MWDFFFLGGKSNICDKVSSKYPSGLLWADFVATVFSTHGICVSSGWLVGNFILRSLVQVFGPTTKWFLWKNRWGPFWTSWIIK